MLPLNAGIAAIIRTLSNHLQNNDTRKSECVTPMVSGRVNLHLLLSSPHHLHVLLLLGHQKKDVVRNFLQV